MILSGNKHPVIALELSKMTSGNRHRIKASEFSKIASGNRRSVTTSEFSYFARLALVGFVFLSLGSIFLSNAAGFEGLDNLSDNGSLQTSFDSESVDLLSWLTLSELDGASAGNDCWGYVSPAGREYAIMGTSSSTVFVEITDPTNVQVIGIIAGPNSSWRDIKVYGQYAYAGTEGGGGIQVIDLSQIDSGTVTLAGSFASGNTHNVAIDTISGYLYRSGSLLIYDLNANPTSPPNVGSWSSSHDMQVVTYTSGPYAGKQVAFCCTGSTGAVHIVDVTDKSNTTVMCQVTLPNASYSHQAWLSEDYQYLYVNDESDEPPLPTTTYIIDVSDLNNAFLAGSFTNGNPAIGHNLYVKDNLIFEANYTSGLRVFDATDPLNPVEVAWFDTYDSDDNASYNGLWSNYPFFPSGTVIGSDMQKGLFVWDVHPGAIETPTSTPTATPTATSDPNYINLSVSPASVSGDGIVKLSWECDFTTWNYEGDPVNVYLAAVMNPEVCDYVSSIADAKKGDKIYFFGHGMKPSKTLEGPTYRNVRFPPAPLSGSKNFKLPTGAAFAGNWKFAIYFVYSGGRGPVRTDGKPVENSGRF